MYHVAYAVDDLVELLGEVGFSGAFPARANVAALKSLHAVLLLQSCVGRSHRSTTSAIRCTPMMSLRYHIEDGVIGRFTGERRGLIREQLLVLRDALLLQGCDDFRHETGQIAPGLYSVLAPDDVLPDKKRYCRIQKRESRPRCR